MYHMDGLTALEPTERPVFNPGLSSNVMARTGQRVRLECVLTAGLPKPTVHWLHNNKPLKETRDVKVYIFFKVIINLGLNNVEF